MSKRIRTCDEFEAALGRVCVARDRMPEFVCMLAPREMPDRSYGLWKVLLQLVHDAIEQQDWSSVGELLRLYDAVQLAGKTGEMWEASYFAFLEDVWLPKEPGDLRKFWRSCPPVFLREIQRDRGIGKWR